MTLDRKFLLCALVYAVFGICVGIYMAASENHSQLVAHAHILLVGFVVSFVYGLIHKLWVAAESQIVAHVQFYLHQFAALAMASGLLLFYGGVHPPLLEQILKASSLGILVSALLMVYLVIKSPREKT